ncbi:MAG: hypothetical protein IPM79_29375 [Polyangiaceae bacterium]|nr:hypothetical protein [Polyangiaceae bacterium]
MGKGQEVDDKLGAIAAATEDLRPSDELTRATLDRVLAAEPVESSLLQLGDATRAIAPADTFTDAVMARILGSVADAPVGDDAFASIAARTAHLRPQDGFTDAIMAEVAPGGTLSDGILRSARPSLLVAAFAAAACLVVSWLAERDYAQESMAVTAAEVSE